MGSDNVSRQFDLYAILAMTHRLPCSINDHLELQQHILQRPPSTGMWAQECKDWLLEQHPQLHQVPPIPDFHDDEAAMDKWADQQKALLGTINLLVTPLPPDRRPGATPGDLMTEVLAKTPDASKVWSADLDKPDLGLDS